MSDVYKWKKLGLVIKPGKYKWMRTHAQNPFSEKIGAGLYRIHFSGRDKSGVARGGYAVIGMKNPCKVLSVSKTPVLDIGNLGCFDDSGVMPSCIIDNQDKKYMYYTGWTLKKLTPFAFYIGLAISSDGGKKYHKYSQGPIIGLNQYEPYMNCSPYVLKENHVWRMWYVSGTKWVKTRDATKAKHFYNIKYAESKDGINWELGGITCIGFRGDEYAIARPVVYKDNNLYKMWYCYRGGKNSYRAGYAESLNGKKWIRKDNNVGIDVSDIGWDSEMICYPCVFRNADEWYMLYNGNNYGATGCGLAKLAK